MFCCLKAQKAQTRYHIMKRGGFPKKKGKEELKKYILVQKKSKKEHFSFKFLVFNILRKMK